MQNGIIHPRWERFRLKIWTRQKPCPYGNEANPHKGGGCGDGKYQKGLKKSRKWLGKPLAIFIDMVYNKPVVCSGMKW